MSPTLPDYYRFHARIYDWTRWAFLFGRGELVKLAARQDTRRILEVGCGTGHNLARLADSCPDAELVGIDCSEDMLAKARARVSRFWPRVSLRNGFYSEPIGQGRPFDLIVFSYCLSMINPGYEEVLRAARADLAPGGRLAVVDFHQTASPAFQSWMEWNHVRMEGQLLSELARLEPAGSSAIRPAYGGLWNWFLWVSREDK